MADDKDPTVEDPHPGLLNGGWPCNAAPPAMSENGKTLTLISHGIPPSHPSIGDYPQQSFILRHESTSTQGEGVKNLSWKRSLRAQPRSSLLLFYHVRHQDRQLDSIPIPWFTNKVPGCPLLVPWDFALFEPPRASLPLVKWRCFQLARHSNVTQQSSTVSYFVIPLVSLR